MKKLLTGFALFTAAAGFAAGNKMSMVTYFPVPYVAYSQVNVGQQMDIGLTNTCNMNLGCTESSVNLKANTVNLKGGQLDLDGGRGVAGNSLTLGTENGGGQIKFQDVRIQDGNMQSLNAQDMRVSTLKLFGHDFPPCAGKGDSDGTMSWQPLTLQGASQDQEELYLVCGKPKDTRCEPTHNGQETYTDEYGIVLTWDYNDCEYKEKETPSGEKKKFLTSLVYCQFEDFALGALNDGMYDECIRLNRWGMQNCPSQCKDVVFLSQLYTSSNSMRESLQKTYTSYPRGCTPGSECSSCVKGKKYAPIGEMMWGKSCADLSRNAYGTGSLRQYLMVPYAECIEAESYTPQTPVSCQTLADGGFTGGKPGVPKPNPDFDEIMKM